MIDVMIGISKSSAVLPEPVVRDRHNIYCKDTGLDLWLNKLLEEFREAAVEAASGNSEALAEELQDIIHVCTTWQAKGLGLNAERRQALCDKVNKKNARRGYFSLDGCKLAYCKGGLMLTSVPEVANND